MEEKYAIHVLQKTADLIESMLQYPNGVDASFRKEMLFAYFASAVFSASSWV